MRLKHRTMIGAEILGHAGPQMAALNIRQSSAAVTSPHCTPKPTRRRVNWSMTTSTQ
jgi:hypothetical protein